MEETVRQLPDGEELVIVYGTSPFRPGPAEDDPRASSFHLRQAAVGTKPSDLPTHNSWPPSSATGEARATATRHPDLTRSAPATQGLGPLDRDRAGSLADEGGVSAATVEARSDEFVADGAPGRSQALWRGAKLLAAGAFAILAGWRIVRRRGHA